MTRTAFGWECPAFCLIRRPDNTLALAPPPAWMVELVDLVSDGVITHQAGRRVLDAWYAETEALLARCLQSLTPIHPINPVPHPQP